MIDEVRNHAHEERRDIVPTHESSGRHLWLGEETFMGIAEVFTVSLALGAEFPWVSLPP